jgi:hypothetical protein
VLNAKLKMFVSKIKGFTRSTCIKSGVVVKKTFKDWKAFIASIPHEKG